MANINDLGIGGQDIREDVNEGIRAISGNRTLFVAKLTDEEPFEPEIMNAMDEKDDYAPEKHIMTLEGVFEHYKPNVNVEFEQEDGSTKEENIQFKNLGDFSPKGFIKQSATLQNLNDEVENLDTIVKQLKSNKTFIKALSNKETKDSYVNLLKVMLQELEGH